jgi:DnaK suppressor protein
MPTTIPARAGGALAMPPAASAAFRSLLEGQRAECIRQREFALRDAAGSVSDPVAASRAVSLLLTIDDIDAALDRLAEGTFGTCVHCGVAIPVERLEFRPHAAGCVGCQVSAG